MYGYFKNKVKNNQDPRLDPDTGTQLDEIIAELQDMARETVEKKFNKALSSFTPTVSYDSRDTIFTPSKGFLQFYIIPYIEIG